MFFWNDCQVSCWSLPTHCLLACFCPSLHALALCFCRPSKQSSKVGVATYFVSSPHMQCSPSTSATQAPQPADFYVCSLQRGCCRGSEQPLWSIFFCIPWERQLLARCGVMTAEHFYKLLSCFVFLVECTDSSCRCFRRLSSIMAAHDYGEDVMCCHDRFLSALCIYWLCWSQRWPNKLSIHCEW